MNRFDKNIQAKFENEFERLILPRLVSSMALMPLDCKYFVLLFISVELKCSFRRVLNRTVCSMRCARVCICLNSRLKHTHSFFLLLFVPNLKRFIFKAIQYEWNELCVWVSARTTRYSHTVCKTELNLVKFILVLWIRRKETHANCTVTLGC